MIRPASLRTVVRFNLRTTMRLALGPALVAIALASAAPASAITFGQLDGNGHPAVAAFIAPIGPHGAPDILCTGTLIAPTVFLTAAHCTDYLQSIGVGAHDVWVTFDPAFSASSTLLPGTYHQDPAYGFSGQGGLSDPNDVAVIVLDAPVATAPAALPTAGLLDHLDLGSTRFTAVGYGEARDIKQKGPAALTFDGQRRVVTQGFLSLQKAWLTLDENPSTGSGGTCYGDSGGPHFIGTSNVIASLTDIGDSVCRASDKTYRLDTASARSFLSQFVSLP